MKKKRLKISENNDVFSKKDIVTYSLLAILAIMLYYFLDFAFLDFIRDYIPFLKRLCFSLCIIFLILLVSKLIERAIIKKTEEIGARYNLVRILNLVSLLAVIIVGISFLFQNLYAAAASFGLASLVLGFALQAPITSFIGWLYIIFRKPYKVGDRIQVNNHTGDVLEITYLDTIMLEIGGRYLGNDRKSSRVIHFPNSNILKEKVTNYNGPDTPFIWNETILQIAYTSDIDFVEEILKKVTDEDFSKQHPSKAKLKEWNAAVYFKDNKYAWLEVCVQYPVTPLDTTGRRNRILKAALPLLNSAQDKVQFPEGTGR